MNIVQHAIDCLDPPTQAELARICGQKPQAVTRWLRTNKVTAKERIVAAIEAGTGGKVTRYDLRRDVFGDAPKEPVVKAA